MRRITLQYYGPLLLIAALISFSACSGLGSGEYDRLVKKELAKGTRSDSLFMGIYLGMPSQAFYAHCWDLNKKRVFTNGRHHTSVLYKRGKDLKNNYHINF